MTDLSRLYEITLDLTRSLVAADRYGRLLEAIRDVIPCDATALLRKEGEALIPIATHGLVPEVRGRRFLPDEQPRLKVICSSPKPVRFPNDSRLPDPFDGLVAGGDHSLDDVHSCLGFPLRIDDQLVGVLAADALAKSAFDHLDEDFLAFVGALAAAVMRTARLVEQAEDSARHSARVARDLQHSAHTDAGEMIGTGAAMERLRAEIDLVARSDLTVLITGETGVGKELVAHAVHEASPRARAPLIHVNCAALPESIAESELFGHVRGAFTGADRTRAGKFEVARGGTLFLDEIGELPLPLQPKLLRAIQEGEIQRVGSDDVQHVDVRIIAATNRRLDREVESGRFRADLFHRLDAYPIPVPPLRDRPEDIPVLAGYFADIARRQLGTGPVRLTPQARDLLRRYTWPGNVRELQNVIARSTLRSAAGPHAPVILDSPTLRPELVATLDPTPTLPPTPDRPLRDLVDDFKRSLITDTLHREHGNLSAAARALGVHRSNLHATAKRLGVLPSG